MQGWAHSAIYLGRVEAEQSTGTVRQEQLQSSGLQQVARMMQFRYERYWPALVRLGCLHWARVLVRPDTTCVMHDPFVYSYPSPVHPEAVAASVVAACPLSCSST